MPTTATPRRANDQLVRLVAVAVLVLAAGAAYLVYRGGTAPTAAPGDRQITITIADRKVTPPTGRVEVGRGTTIRITVTSDVPDQLHVHGYDRAAVLSPGIPATVEFRADMTGLFEVETHGAHTVLLQLVVR